MVLVPGAVADVVDGGVRRKQARLVVRLPMEKTFRVAEWRELAQTAFSYDTSRYYTLRVENNGPRMRAFVDGKLLLEAADAVRAAARKHGYTEREVYEPGRSFDWSELAHAGASLSLFGSRKIVELRLASGKPAAQASDAILAWCERPNPEALLLATMPRPEGGGWWEAPWFLALNKAGVIVEVQPVARAALPGWLEKRLARQKQSASREALEYLADRVEGNLLAAHQEVQKLALLAGEGELSLETVRDAVADVARFDTYVAAEALVAGNTERYLRVLDGLRGEGEAAALVLWAICEELRALAAIQAGRAAGRTTSVPGAGRRGPR